MRLRTKQGKYLWFDSRGQALWNAKGQPLRMVGSIQDITDRKIAETALQESEERFRSLSELSPIGIYETDADGRWVYSNARWQEIAGLSESESLGDGWTSAIDPRDKGGTCDR